LDGIPAEVLVVTIGCDVQDDRLEATVVGWTRTGEALVLAHFVIWGSFQDETTWAEFDETLRTKWKHSFGGMLKVDATVIDCGDGDHYDTVMNFAAPRIKYRTFAGKGVFGSRPGFAIAKKGKVGGRLAIIGVDVLKTVTFDRLQRGRSIRFSHTLELSYFEQLAAEKRIVRHRKGRPVRRFERVSQRARAEALDALVYAFAAKQALPNINWDRREAQLKGTAARRSLASLLPR
jgi:phage terminase large subunit GpA-like protein